MTLYSRCGLLFLAAGFLLTPLPAKAESAGPRISYQIPRLALLYEAVRIDNIPDYVRTVSEYNRSSLTHELPSATKGSMPAVSIGIGITFADRLTLACDVAWFDSYSGGRTTWSEIGFPSDDYLGYRYHGRHSDLSASMLLFRFNNGNTENKSGLYIKAGQRIYNAALDSGSDAWSEFHSQHSVPVTGEAFFYGAGIKLFVFDFEYLTAEVSDRNPRVRSNSLSVRFSLEI